MNSNILAFLEAYKSLDDLCKQILSSDRGISKYIDEMGNEQQGERISDWETDYKHLKKMRWIRNQLVHDPNSFDKDLFTLEDIEWLKRFRYRIIERTDPFAMLLKSKNTNNTVKPTSGTIRESVIQQKDCNWRNDKSSFLKWVIGGVVIIGIVIFLYLFFLSS